MSERNDHDDTTPETVRLTVTGDSARQAALEWLEDLPADPLGTRGRDGWMVKEIATTQDTVVLDIRSADRLDEATTEAVDVLKALGCDVQWERV
ncbi:hypothetical protein [Corynebacterium auris]|uniref:hypothetical protein n=1 Tax=Corynebacterium auris TaxID=44750 RepID=UPI0025B60A22|nr:hypothetical protein [Corynebacterium auris]WJY69088.1 hypothetical protein CAURIS_11100 [Corynebacterium auris]